MVSLHTKIFCTDAKIFSDLNAMFIIDSVLTAGHSSK